MNLVDQISNWIKTQVEESKAKGVVVGLSGGVDSSVVAALSKKAVGNNVLGLIMPCFSQEEDEYYARLIAEKLNIKAIRIRLDSIYQAIRMILDPIDVEGLSEDNKMALANIKPRLRMITLYYFANCLNYLVAGTGNKSELMVGYFTKYGDGGVDILPLGGLLKSEVRELANELGIPKEIIEKTPSAGLWPEQTDEGELGISYDELDKAILALEFGNRGDLDSSVLAKVEDLIRVSEHKRSPPKIFRVASA